ncbi:amidase [Clostridia bacterium]|nr:amidase [Clostridia bacterium]
MHVSSSGIPRVLIEQLTWPVFQQAIARDPLIIIPVGSTEEHGLHNPLGTDFYIARALAKALGERTGALVAPAIPIGNAEGLTDFPGTISIDPAILTELLLAVCGGFVQHGARRFFFVNGHGGNNAAIRIAAQDMYRSHGVFSIASEWWQWMPSISEYQAHDHGGQYETSMMMAVDERLVNLDKAHTVQLDKLTGGIAFDYGFQYRGVPIGINLPTPIITPNGNFGSPAEDASLEIGEGMFRAYIDYCAGLIDTLRAVSVEYTHGGERA